MAEAKGELMPKREWVRRKKSVPKCWWCGEDSDYLCDQVIGRDRDTVTDPGEKPSLQNPQGRPPGTLISTDDEFFTCDAPMCNDHRQQVGHICARGRGKRSDSIDCCWYHEMEPRETQRLISKTEAGAFRRRMKMAVEHKVKHMEHEDFYG